MTDRSDTSTIRAAVERRLAKRYRAERRFRIAGVTAVATAVGILAILLTSIFSQGISAFAVNQITLPVELEEDLVDPQGDGSEASLRRGS